MGYKPKRTLYRLTFDDPDFEGLEVVTRRISVDGLMKFAGMLDAAEGFDAENFKAEDLKIVTQLFERFAKVLAEWNVEDDDDQPVPRTADGLMSLDFEFAMALINAWVTGMSQAPPPLNGSSPSGGSSPEGPLAAASRSRSPES